PHVLGTELDAAGDEVAKLAELAHCLRDPGAQAVHVRAALGGGDEIHVAFAERGLRIRSPAQCVADRVVIAGARAGDRLRRNALVLAELLDEVRAEIAAVEPLVFLTARFVPE